MLAQQLRHAFAYPAHDLIGIDARKARSAAPL
jgi:hypothetical protein